METAPAPLFPRSLRVVLFVALVVRLGWGLSQASDAGAIERLPDQREYLELSHNLLQGAGLHFVDPRFGEEVWAYRTPGYPAFLAMCGGSPRVARGAQALLDVSTVWAVYLLALRWLTPGRSVAAAAIVAVNPFLIYFSGLILSETLFTAMLTWGMLLLVGSREAEDADAPWLRRGHPLVGGLILALAVLVRPSGMGLPVVLGLVAAWLNRRQRGAYPGWWPLPPGATMLALTLVVLAPWAYRNRQVLGKWVWTTTNAGITAYDGFNDEATGASDQRFATRVPGIMTASELQRDAYFTEAASNWMRHHPGRVAELAMKKIARTWSPVPLSAEYGRPLYRWAGGLYAVPLDVLVILGLCYGRIARAAKVYLLIPAIYITAVHAMSVGSLRYRLPAEPMMAILAAASAQLLAARKPQFMRWGESPSSLATGN